MTRLLRLFLMTVLVLSLSGAIAIAAHAQSIYVVTDNDNASAQNTTSLYQYISGTGLVECTPSSSCTPTSIKHSPFKTGSGQDGLGGGSFGLPGVGIATTDKCAFVVNAGTNSIGYSKAPFSTWGVYTAGITFNPSLGGSVAIDNAHSVLYINDTAFGSEGSIEQVKFNADCVIGQLSIIASNPTHGGIAHGMVVSPDGACVFTANADGSVSSFTTKPLGATSGSPYASLGYSNYGSVPISAATTNDNWVVFDDMGGTSELFDAYAYNSSCVLSSDTLSGPINPSGSEAIYGSSTFTLVPAASGPEHIYTVGTLSGSMAADTYMGGGVVVSNSACTNQALAGWGSNFDYPGADAYAASSATGTGVVVAEGSFMGTASFIGGAKVSSSGCFTATIPQLVGNESFNLLSLVTVANPSE